MQGPIFQIRTIESHDVLRSTIPEYPGPFTCPRGLDIERNRPIWTIWPEVVTLGPPQWLWGSNEWDLDVNPDADARGGTTGPTGHSYNPKLADIEPEAQN